MNVLFLAAEASPFVKIGGLADVAGSLPRALRSLPAESVDGVNLDVRVAIPLHAVIRAEATALRSVTSYSLPRSDGDVDVQVFEARSEDLPVYFIGGGPVNASGSVYSSRPELDGEKYTFFSLAALELTKQLGWQPDVIHANDWHAALAVYALLLKRWDGDFAGTASVLTVHNLPFAGPDVTGNLAAYGLPLAQTDLPDWAHTLPLPLGLWAADGIGTVSPTYAQEMLTPEYGVGLEMFLRQRADTLTGILNGIDMDTYNPETDEALTVNFTAETLAARARNKAALQGYLGLEEDPDIPLLGIVSRMEPQKGVDLALKALRKIRDEPWQAVILGTGDRKLELAARRLQAQMPERVRAEIRFDGQLARQVYGGADIFLMPSRYEPCGLSQMIAMRYGCVPVVHATGGLKDTVKPDETGFLFEKATPAALAKAIRQALTVYPDRDRWQALQRNGMAQDFSWTRSAKQYVALYQSLLSKLTS